MSSFPHINNALTFFCLVSFAYFPFDRTLADGNRITTLQLPYVQQLETEIEYRVLIQQDKSENLDELQYHTLGLGKSLSDTVFAEIALMAVNTGDGNLTTDQYEIEFLMQLSEQGEFRNDWGLMVELERNTELNSWEIGSTLIVLHEWTYFIGLVNATVAYEWGQGLDAEIETSLATQLKYRYKAAFEPALEFHLAQDTHALGPVATGVIKFSGRKKLAWTGGVLLGLDSSTADKNWVLNLEYEF